MEGAGGTADLLAANAALVMSQARLESLGTGPAEEGALRTAATAAVAGCKIHLLDVVDLDAERDRLTKQQAKLAKAVKSTEGKLANQGFVAKAPEAVVNAEREKLEGYRSELAEVERLLASLG